MPLAQRAVVREDKGATPHHTTLHSALLQDDASLSLAATRGVRRTTVSRAPSDNATSLPDTSRSITLINCLGDATVRCSTWSGVIAPMDRPAHSEDSSLRQRQHDGDWQEMATATPTATTSITTATSIPPRHFSAVSDTTTTTTSRISATRIAATRTRAGSSIVVAETTETTSGAGATSPHASPQDSDTLLTRVRFCTTAPFPHLQH